MSDRSTRLNLENDDGFLINPATEDKQDDVIDNQTNGSQKVVIQTLGEDVSTNNPSSDGSDSIYAKDIDTTNSTIGTFTGDILSLFNDYNSEITDVSGTNPKTYTLRFKRPVNSNKIAMGSRTGNFSNVKIQLKDLSGTVRTVIDDSDNDIKFTSNVYAFTTNIFIEAVIEFHTTDEVAISGMSIPKSLSRNISSIDGYISDTNSSETPLIADAIFTGTQVDTLNYGMILISIHSDVASATDGLSLEFRASPTGEWIPSDSYTIAAGSLKTFSVQTVFRFMRIIYTNGGVGQTTMCLQTTLKPVYVKPSSHRVADTINGQDDAELSKANLIGSDQNGIYQNVRATEVGNLMTADFLVEVSRGNIPGYSFVRKFGYNPAITTATADIWEYGGIEITARLYTFSADGVADIDRISSDNATDIVVVSIDGLDIDGNQVIQEITLTGQTPVALTTSLWRVNRVFNNNSTATLGNVYVFVNGATTAGVPDIKTTVRGYFSIANQQTLQSIYTIPAGKTGYFYGLQPSIVKKQAAFATYTGKAKEFGKVSRTQDIFGLTTTGTSKSNDVFPIPLPFPEKTDFIPNADPDATIGFSLQYLVLLINN